MTKIEKISCKYLLILLTFLPATLWAQQLKPSEVLTAEHLNDSLERELFKMLDGNAKNGSFDFFQPVFFGKKGSSDTYQLRKDLFDKYISHNISMLEKADFYHHQGTFIESTELLKYVEYIQYGSGYVGDRDENTAFLLDRIIQIANATYRQYKRIVDIDTPVGDVLCTYDMDVSIKDRLEKKDYYGYELLKEYSETYLPPYERENGNGEHSKKHYGIVSDADGYANVREGRGVDFKVVATVKSGAKVQILSYGAGLNRKAAWWYIQIPEGKQRGFVHQSRIKSDI